MTTTLRLLAFAIAIAGMLDPAITMAGASRSRIAIVATQSAPDIAAVHDRLVRDLASSFEIVPGVTADAAAAVMIGNRVPDDAYPEALRIATVTVPERMRSGVRIVRVEAPHAISSGTALHLRVELEASGISGQTTEVTVAIAGLELGRVSHQWTRDNERWSSGVDIVPIGEPPWVVRVEAMRNPVAASTGTPTSDARTDVVVDIRRTPLRVEFYDPRPSWATTFVRRALEADTRFQVASISVTSRGISAQAGGAVPLGDPQLDTFDVVIVGGLDRLSASDARALERFMRDRGGAVVLVPDERIGNGPARDLLSNLDMIERLLERPAALAVVPPTASLRASELLVAHVLAPGVDVIARLPGLEAGTASGSGGSSAGDDSVAVIVSAPRGGGRLLVSGAMDAWRYRALDNSAFDRFWRSTVAGLALDVPPPVSVTVDPPIARPGERAIVTVRVRSRDADGVSASIEGEPIRLVPDPETGVYRGGFVAPLAGVATLQVRTGGASEGTASVVVRPHVERVQSTAAPALALLASSYRGIDVSPE